MLKDLGERLKLLRGRVSRQDFVERFSTSTSSLIRWENGERPPDLTFLLAVAEAYGVSADWLIYGKGDGPAQSLAPFSSGGLPGFSKNVVKNENISRENNGSIEANKMLQREIEGRDKDIARLFTEKRELAKEFRELCAEVDDKAKEIDILTRERHAALERLRVLEVELALLKEQMKQNTN